MSAPQSWLFFAVLVGCSSSPSAAPVPEGTPHTDTALSTSQSSTARSGGQSGTDSGNGYGCEDQGAPPLASVPVDQTPDGYLCSPAAVLAVSAGTHAFECTVDRVALVPATDSTPAEYIHSQDAGPSLTVQLQPGAAAHLLDAVATGEDGGKSSCTLLGIDVSASINSADGGVAVTADQVVVDRFCSVAAIRANTRLHLFGSEEDAAMLLFLDAMTGRVQRLEFRAEPYSLSCSATAADAD